MKQNLYRVQYEITFTNGIRATGQVRDVVAPDFQQAEGLIIKMFEQEENVAHVTVVKTEMTAVDLLIPLPETEQPKSPTDEEVEEYLREQLAELDPQPGEQVCLVTPEGTTDEQYEKAMANINAEIEASPDPLTAKVSPETE